MRHSNTLAKALVIVPVAPVKHALRLCRMGNVYASVLPEPVGATASTSRP